MKPHWRTSSHNAALYILGVWWIDYDFQHHHHNILQFHCPKNPHALLIQVPTSIPTPGLQWSFHCLPCFAFSSGALTWSHTDIVPTSRLLRVFKVCINFFCVFHGLIAHFFSVLNSVLLSEVALFNHAFTDFASCLDMESGLLRC